MNKYPELTYITADYANSSISNFQLIKNGKALKKQPEIKESFFFIYIPWEEKMNSIEEKIVELFPNFPINKAFTCKINLIYPDELNENTIPNNWVRKLTIGKILPVALSTQFLLDIPYFKNINKKNLIQNALSGSIYFWSLCLKLGLQLVSCGNFIPNVNNKHISHELAMTQNIIGRLESKWIPIFRSKLDIQNFIYLQKSAPFSSHNYYDSNISLNAQQTISKIILDYLSNLIEQIIQKSQKSMNYKAFSNIYGFNPNDASKLGEKLSWEIRLLSALSTKDHIFSTYKYSEQIIPDLIRNWTKIVDHKYWKQGFNFVLKLNLPETDSEDWIIKFFIQDTLGVQEMIPLNLFWESFHESNIKNLRKSRILNFELKNKILLRQNILRSLYLIGKIFNPILKSMDEIEPLNIKINTKEASQFLEYFKPILENNGITIIVPDAFERNGKQRLNVVMKISSQISPEEISVGNISKTQTEFDMNSILSYNWKLKIGENFLSSNDFEEILKLEKQNSIIKWNDQWIKLDRNEIEEIQSNFSQNKGGKIRADEALFFGLNGKAYIDPKQSSKRTSSGPYEVLLDGPLEEIVNVLTGKKKISKIKQPKTLNAKLRPYQLDGFNWLETMTSLGFNVCLADDMGLGKTIQVISYTLYKKEKIDKLNVLIVCPTSVLGNWEKEVQHFAPSLCVDYYYGANRPTNIGELNKFLQKNDMIFTSYGLLRRDIDLLKKINWDIIVMDESQNIKNYKAQQTEAAYELEGYNKICLTGTPIENHLMELWSLFHFLNSFLLGKRTTFRKKYYIPIERMGDPKITEELRNIISPFLLRRLKSDKNIIKDLPEKQEIKTYINLSQDQMKLYSKIVEDGIVEIENQDKSAKNSTIQRNGAILNLILKLKQVCNHPMQVNNPEFGKLEIDNAQEFIKKSGKIERLIEMLEEIIDSDQKILIFTQFKQMGSILEKIILKKLKVETLFLHGGVPQPKRTKMVEKFQNDDLNLYPIFLLSLKAGGTGLNLTKASAVLHFDRWWNPAVENQATDRAYRIGQKNKVMVYKFISIGTIEEKIDKMIEEKKELAENIVSSAGENWITNLNDKDLKKLFTLEERLYGGD